MVTIPTVNCKTLRFKVSESLGKVFRGLDNKLSGRNDTTLVPRGRRDAW